MGFTIGDMLILSKDQYEMELISGTNGWSNSISWVLMLEDLATINHFAGKELVVTTGLGFDSEEKWLRLAAKLVDNHASGLIINTGGYLYQVPERLKQFCDENDLPLLTVPWEVVIADMIKDISFRLFVQGSADEQITKALISAIEKPDNQEFYKRDLLPYFDVDGIFRVVLITADGLDEMDSVERKKLAYRLQIYLENITHNGSFFYYDGNFVLVMNNVSYASYKEIIDGMIIRTKRRMTEIPIFVGAGSEVFDITKLHLSFARAKAAVTMAKRNRIELLQFDDMGLFRLLYSITDESLLQEMGTTPLEPLIAYDKKHGSNYLETLELYLKYNGSIQAVAEATYTHRNTVIYRVANIKRMLNTELETTEERLKYQVAFYIRNM